MVGEFLQSRTGLKISKSHEARQTGCILNIHLYTMRFVRQADRFERVGCGIWCCELVVKTQYAWHTDVAMWKQTLLTPALGKTHVCSCRVWNERCFFFFMSRCLVSWSLSDLLGCLYFLKGLPEGTHGVNNETSCKHKHTHTETFPSSASPNPTPPLACLFSSDPHLLFFTSLQSFRSSLPPSFLILFPPYSSLLTRKSDIDQIQGFFNW